MWLEPELEELRQVRLEPEHELELFKIDPELDGVKAVKLVSIHCEVVAIQVISGFVSISPVSPEITQKFNNKRFTKQSLLKKTKILNVLCILTSYQVLHVPES